MQPGCTFSPVIQGDIMLGLSMYIYKNTTINFKVLSILSTV